MKATLSVCIVGMGNSWDNFPVIVEEADLERFVQCFVDNSHHFSGPNYRFDNLNGAFIDAAKVLLDIDVDEIRERARLSLKVRKDNKQWYAAHCGPIIRMAVTEKLIDNVRVWKRVKEAVKANGKPTHEQRVQWRINEIDDQIEALKQRRDELC